MNSSLQQHMPSLAAAAALRAQSKRIFPSGTEKLQLLSGIKPIEKQPEARKPEIAAHPAMEKAQEIVDAYLFFHKQHMYDLGGARNPYAKALRMVEGTIPWRSNSSPFLSTPEKIDVTQEELQFFLFLVAQQDVKPWNVHHDTNIFSETCGYFISALLNCSSAQEFHISVSHLQEPLDILCFRNSKKVTIEGDAGNYFGAEMEGGELTLNGNAGANACERMSGGTVEIKGNCKGIENTLAGSIVKVEGEIGQLGIMRANPYDPTGTIRHSFGRLMEIAASYRGAKFDFIQLDQLKGPLYYKGKLIVESGRLIT